MSTTQGWSELNKDGVHGVIIEIDAVGVERVLHKVWRRRDVDDAHWERLIQIVGVDGALGTSVVLAWQDDSDVWHPLVDIEPGKLAELLDPEAL
ncbi:hypothetical protein [Amycolatopsis sp. CA-230715]|uniref:hypothetical protein n=1 Tax=Amycolatopsis sp. CA-230715 TaxID=2745196 RepID=UPI001C031E97|nr:hypothetical protein [Amycolatopsis sp. CA-230715]QWF85759.1 hypothetical protein HUW46_09239 [Amycolatopsis sp. CA-230715]